MEGETKTKLAADAALDAGTDAIQKAAEAAKAVEAARAADTASLFSKVKEELNTHTTENMKQYMESLKSTMITIVNDALGQNPARYVDISRIPLICKSIFDITQYMKSIDEKLDTKYVSKEKFEPVQEAVEALRADKNKVVWLVISVVILALLGLVVGPHLIIPK